MLRLLRAGGHKIDLPGIRQDDDCDSVQEMHGCDWREEEKPKPKEQVDLLVDNVQTKNTKAVELLLPCGSTNAMECATETEITG